MYDLIKRTLHTISTYNTLDGRLRESFLASGLVRWGHKWTFRLRES